MKRAISATDTSQAPKKQPRQDPVSCQTCRKRKLKCDRNRPCSGCSARNIECVYHTNTNGFEAGAIPAVVRSPARENTVNRGTSSEPQNVEEPTQNQDANESLRTTDWLETIVMGHWFPNAVPKAHRTEPLHGGQPGNALQDPSNASGSYHDRPRGGHAITQQSPVNIHLPSYLPPETEVLSLFRYYCDHLDFHYHAIIPSRVEQQIRNIYDQHSRQEPSDLNHIALLFSIMASALHYKLPEESSSSVSRSQAAVFLSGSALIQSNYVAYPTIEGLQATMIVGHNLSSTGLPSAVSSLFVPRFSINQAIHMSLHLVDCQRLASERESQHADRACLELKRRLWWSLVSNDWLLSYLSGPQEWTYSVNPRHMNVRLPLNIEDEDIDLSDTGLALSTPTAMSYTLCRIRLAEISRQIADETTDQHFQGKDLPYDSVVALDSKLRAGLNELPEFYRFSPAAQQQFVTLYNERPVFASQRSMLQLGYHFRLCRLHRQHFVRGAKDPRYSYSHVVCLASARTVLEIKRIMDEDSPVMTPSSSLIWAVMHHVFVAAVILLIDVCYNWEDVLAVKRKEEVIAACRMLTHAHRSSAVARRAVDAMMDVLRKHWIHVRGLNCPQAQAQAQILPAARPAEATQQSFGVDTPDSMWYTSEQDQRQEGGHLSQVEIPLEDLWKEMLDGSAQQAGLDTPDWTDLLNDLTNANYPGEL